MIENYCRVKGWQVLGGSMRDSSLIETRGSAPNPVRDASLNWRLKTYDSGFADLIHFT